MSKFFLILSLFSVVIVTNFTIYPFVVGKVIFFRVAVELALLFFLLEIFKNPSKFFSKARIIFQQPIVIAATFFILCFSLAGIFGYDFQTSFWSNFVRGEGIFQMWHYYVFFLLAILLFDNEESWKRFFVCSLVAGLAMIILGIPAWLKTYESGSRFGGAIGNAAFTSSYLLFALFYLSYLLKSYEVQLRKILVFGIIFVLAVIFLTGTRGTFLGLVVGALTGLTYLSFRSYKAYKSYIISLLVIGILIFGFLFYFQPSRIFQISWKEQTAQTRFWTWGSAWKGWQERPILGWGPENFSEVFNKYFDKRHYTQTTEVWFDRAHNTYIDYLTETGILGLLSYLLIWIVFYYQLFRSKIISNGERILFFSLPIAYLVQNLLIFETLPSYINLFLFLGFASYKFNNFQFSISNFQSIFNERIFKAAVIIFILIVPFSLYFGSYRPFVKSILINNALAQMDKINSAEEFKNNFSKALDYYSPYGQDEGLKMTGGVILDLLKRDLPPEVGKDLVNFLNDKYQPILDRGRGNNFAQNYYILGKVNSLVGNKEEAKKYYETAFEMWPARPEFQDLK